MALVIIIFLIGFIAGVIAEYFLLSTGDSKTTSGSFIINSKDPDEEVFRIEFDKPIQELIGEKIIRLKVDKDI